MTDYGRLYFLIKQINNRAQTLADATYKKYDLTSSQVRVLDYLLMNGGQTTQKEIEEYLCVSHPNAVGLVTRLRKREFVVTHTSQNDRRNKEVCITDKGREVLDRMAPDRVMLQNRLIRRLTEGEIASLERMLEIVQHNFE